MQYLRSFRILMVAALCLAPLWPLHAQSNHAADYNNLGIEAYNAGSYKESIQYFEKAYEGAPSHATVRRNLCNAHQAQAAALANQGNFPTAMRHLDTAIGADPENHSPLVQLGSYYLRNDMVDEAIFRLEEAIELKPGVLDAHELLGEAYYRDNDLPSARAQWEYVLQMAPQRKELQERYNKAFREESVEYDFHRAGSRHFRISYPQGVTYHLRATVLNILEKAYWDIGRKLGGVYVPAPIQVIIYSAEQFTEATNLDAHVGAVYDGKIRSPVTYADGQPLPQEELRRRLTHEYVHVVIRHMSGNKVPWWLNEGLAETFSDGIEDGEAAYLARAFSQGLAFSLSDLEAHQLRKLEPEPLRLAYTQSHATCHLLWTRFGQQRLVRLLADLNEGHTPEEALRRNYHRSYAAIEQDVAASYQ